jgi:8-oxo-dGTP pyrophosphatase MutT (NUDIX family)
MNDQPLVFHVDRLDLTYKPKPWDYAIERRAEIDAFFASLQREKPALWNGRVLLLYDPVMADGVFHGAFLETDYASFSAWRRSGWPPAGVHDSFGAAAIQSSDGAFLLGRMAPHTFNAGMIYFPAGTPDANDIVDGRVDLEFSVRRELKEETGLDAAEFSAEPGWSIVNDEGLIVHFKVFRSGQSAEALRARVQGELARQKDPEFSEIRIVRGPQDFDPAMPRFVKVFLAHWFGGG